MPHLGLRLLTETAERPTSVPRAAELPRLRASRLEKAKWSTALARQAGAGERCRRADAASPSCERLGRRDERRTQQFEARSRGTRVRRRVRVVRPPPLLSPLSSRPRFASSSTALEGGPACCSEAGPRSAPAYLPCSGVESALVPAALLPLRSPLVTTRSAEARRTHLAPRQLLRRQDARRHQGSPPQHGLCVHRRVDVRESPLSLPTCRPSSSRTRLTSLPSSGTGHRQRLVGHLARRAGLQRCVWVADEHGGRRHRHRLPLGV